MLSAIVVVGFRLAVARLPVVADAYGAAGVLGVANNPVPESVAAHSVGVVRLRRNPERVPAHALGMVIASP